MSAQIEIMLQWKKDKAGQLYLVGHADLPATIDLSNLLLFVWPNPPESEEAPVLVLRNRGSEEGRRDKNTVWSSRSQSKKEN